MLAGLIKLLVLLCLDGKYWDHAVVSDLLQFVEKYSKFIVMEGFSYFFDSLIFYSIGHRDWQIP